MAWELSSKHKIIMEEIMEFAQICLETKNELDSYLKQENYKISDISFGNLFIWSCARKIEFTKSHNTLILKTTYPNENPYFFFPIGIGDKKQALQKIAKYCQSCGIAPHFKSIESSNLETLKEVFPHLEITPSVDNFDYVYSISELITLSGRKYHKKKNHLNQFLLNYPQWKYEKISKDNAKDVICVAQKWFDSNPNQTKALESENLGIKNALEAWEWLGLKGGFVHLDGKIVGFSFGEVINNEMVVIHIEKADNKILGAYQIINQQLLANEFNQYLYANREEDLGIEGLRRAKKSYNPVFMVEKYSAK